MLCKRKDNDTTYESTCSSIKNSPVIKKNNNKKKNSYIFRGEKIRKVERFLNINFFLYNFLKLLMIVFAKEIK